MGTGTGLTNIYTGTLGTATSKTLTALPLDGSTIYVRLWSFFNSAWQSYDYTFTASATEDPKAYLISPEPSSKLTGSSVTFIRTSTGASNYWLDVGIKKATGDLFVGSFAASTSLTLNNIPLGSQVIYVRLWTMVNSVWQANEYTFLGPP